MLTHRKTMPSPQTLRNHYPFSVNCDRDDHDEFRLAHLGVAFFWRPPTSASSPRWMFRTKADLDKFMAWARVNKETKEGQ